MGTEEKWVRSSSEGDEDESLSLSDLPVDLLPQESANEEVTAVSEDFDFGRVLSGFGSVGSKSESSEMCAADDIFFKGQILPFRSESMDRSSSTVGGFASFSSRSSSSNSNSHNSTTSSSWASSSKNSSTTAGSGGTVKTRVLNRFHTYPSPKPQVIKTHNVNPPPARSRSSVWGNLRLGLVRAPGIEFQPDLKSRSTGSGSSRTEKQSTSKNPPPVDAPPATRTSSGRLLFSGCDCGIGGAIQPAAIMKEGHFRKDSGREEVKQPPAAAAEEKKKQGRGGKEETSRHRTVEWIIKELSHGSFMEERDSISSA